MCPKDDFYVTQAKCINVADAGKRAQCVTEARQARSEAGTKAQSRLGRRQLFLVRRWISSEMSTAESSCA